MSSKPAPGASPSPAVSEEVSRCGSMGSSWRSRMASMARFRVIVSSQVDTLLRLGSYAAACRQTRRKASCATSSAIADDPTIEYARPYTRAWYRRTNAAAVSVSPDAIPASSDSSERVPTLQLRARQPLRVHGPPESLSPPRPYQPHKTIFSEEETHAIAVHGTEHHRGRV